MTEPASKTRQRAETDFAQVFALMAKVYGFRPRDLAEMTDRQVNAYLQQVPSMEQHAAAALASSLGVILSGGRR